MRGVVLDAVGTLITPRPSVSQVYVAAAARQGVVIGVDAMRHRFRASFGQDEADEARGPLATSEDVERRRWKRIVAQCLPEVPDPIQAFLELWDHFARPESWIVYQDVPGLLESLRELHLPHRIASNFDARLRPVLLGLPHLRHLADDAVISSEVGYRKPDARFFEAACRSLGLASHEVLHVGDDERNDREGALNANMLSLRLNRDPSSASHEELGSLAELAHLFRRSRIEPGAVRRPMT